MYIPVMSFVDAPLKSAIPTMSISVNSKGSYDVLPKLPYSQ
jgi:hypothetical protein